MEAHSSLVFLLVAVIVLCGTTKALHPSCSEVSKCTGNQFGKAVGDKHGDKTELCKHFKESLACMEPLLETCLPSVDDSMAIAFTSNRDMLQTRMKKDCKDDSGIASTSAECNQESLARCAPFSTDLTKAGSKGVGAICMAMNKLRKCLDDLHCPGGSAITAAFMKPMEEMEKNGIKCEGGKAASGTVDLSKCGNPGCESKEGCALYKCMLGFKTKCESQWKVIYQGEGKKSFDELAEKCGCGSLKASFLFVVASAVLMFLRF